MNLQYEVQFNYEGLWNKEDQDKARFIIHYVQNEIVNTMNSLIIDEFNSEWEKLHPEINGMEEGSSEWKEYNKFIAEKFNEKTLAIRNTCQNMYDMDVKFDPDMNAGLVVSNSHGGKAYITLKPVERI